MLSLNSNLSSKLTVKNIIIGQILLFNMKPDSLFYNISKKSKFFRRIYLYYNIYIRNIKFLFKSSQFNEDLKIFPTCILPPITTLLVLFVAARMRFKVFII